MSEFKLLSESKALDPYQDKFIKVISSLKCPSQGMIDFLSWMAETGWEQYIKEDFLREAISKFSIDTINKTFDEDMMETFDGKRNYDVLPKLQERDFNRLMWKWQGNLMEIIAGNMFRQKVHPLTNKYELECWTGDSKEDMGVDGWCQHVSNPKFKVGIQVKYRLERDIKWNDQISKCMAITEQTVRQLYRDNVLTDKEWCQWGKKIPARSIIVTTTKIGGTVEDENDGSNPDDDDDHPDATAVPVTFSELYRKITVIIQEKKTTWSKWQVVKNQLAELKAEELRPGKLRYIQMVTSLTKEWLVDPEFKDCLEFVKTNHVAQVLLNK